MSYMSGFCEAGFSHNVCQGFFFAYGKTPALRCACICHELPELIRRAGGPDRAAHILLAHLGPEVDEEVEE